MLENRARIAGLFLIHIPTMQRATRPNAKVEGREYHPTSFITVQ
jgi:hypothetical protein